MSQPVDDKTIPAWMLAAPPPPPPPKPWRRILAWSVAVTTLCAVVAVVAYVVTRPQGPAGERASTAHPGDLRAYLLPAPLNASPLPDAPADEHLSLQQSAAFADDPEAVADGLNRLGYQEGAVRTWQQPDAAVCILLLRFSSDVGALTFYQDVEVPIMDQYQPDVHQVEDAAPSLAAADTSSDSSGVVHSLGAALNRNVVLLLTVAQPTKLYPNLIDQLVKRQYQRL